MDLYWYLRKEQAASPVSIPHCTRRAVKHRLVVIWTRSLVVSPKYLLPFRKNVVAEFECLTNIGILTVSRKVSVSGLFACSRKFTTAAHETVAPKNHVSFCFRLYFLVFSICHFAAVVINICKRSLRGPHSMRQASWNGPVSVRPSALSIDSSSWRRRVCC